MFQCSSFGKRAVRPCFPCLPTEAPRHQGTKPAAVAEDRLLAPTINLLQSRAKELRDCTIPRQGTVDTNHTATMVKCKQIPIDVYNITLTVSQFSRLAEWYAHFASIRPRRTSILKFPAGHHLPRSLRRKEGRDHSATRQRQQSAPIPSRTRRRYRALSTADYPPHVQDPPEQAQQGQAIHQGYQLQPLDANTIHS